MQTAIYLFFSGNCREAFTHYGEVFGATPDIMSAADMPPGEGVPEMPADTVMHAALRLGDDWIFGSDDPSGSTPAMAGCNLSVSLPNDAETRRVYQALSEGGDIRQPLAPEFWTSLYSAFTDRHGIRWMVMTESAQP
ncbi:VOC family protein [Sinisalibacter aestuarii]|uniref:VOC family protein n=1 Tax=Sinisalibacter aestuarii TaxID=2949426 RepID=A0ABQ5LQ98_9RHOB|nr:VOC family protein [Sinisalibacter aestuarii]GKY87099.1 VOC family protein [Sinisalibacter aestuarii]